MAKYPLTERQKDLIRSLAPGLRDGTVETEWTVARSIGTPAKGIPITILRLSNDLLLSGWKDVKTADFDAFVQCGFFNQKSQTSYTLNEALILDAVDHNFADDEPTPSAQINFYGGDFRGAIVNAAATLTDVQQSIGATPLSDDAKAQLTQLIEQLKEALANAELPEDEAEEAEAAAHHVQAAVDQLNSAQPNKRIIKSSVNEFEKAIKNVGRIVPPIIALGAQIATLLRPFIG